MDAMDESFRPLVICYAINANAQGLLLNPNALIVVPSSPEPLLGTRILHRGSAKAFGKHLCEQVPFFVKEKIYDHLMFYFLYYVSIHLSFGS